MHREEYERYSRQLELPSVGLEGQKRLKHGHVLVVGAGGLGCPALTQLASSGVGYIGVIDGDTIDRSNLPRQYLFKEADIGENKATVTAQHLRKLNPYIRVNAYPHFLDSENAEILLRDYSIVIDASDRARTRYTLSTFCARLGLAHVYGAVEGFCGQVAVFNVYHSPGTTYSYSSLFPKTPDSEHSCSQNGILCMVPSSVGTLQALEALKLLLGENSPLQSQLLEINLTHYSQRLLQLPSQSIHRNASAYQLTPLPSGSLPIKIQDLSSLLHQSPPPYLIDSSQVPLQVLSEAVSSIDPQRALILHCQKGLRSALIAKQLKSLFPEREVYYVHRDELCTLELSQ